MATKTAVISYEPPPVTAESIARCKAAADEERRTHFMLTGDHIDAAGCWVRDERPTTEGR